MLKKMILPTSLLLLSIALFSLVMVVDLFSIHSGLLSAIKSNSDDTTYLFFNQDILQYHLGIAGWQFAYPTYLLPLLIVNLFAGLFFSGFYVTIATTLMIAFLFIFFCFWAIQWTFQEAIQSKTLLLVFILLLMAMITANPVMMQAIPIAEIHGGTVLLSVIFLGIAMRYLTQPSSLSLMGLSIFNLLSIFSDLLFVVSCTLPFTLALLILNIHQRKKSYSYLIYALTLSTFIGGLSASYLRYLNYSLHASVIMISLSAIVALLLLPLLWMPKIIDSLQPYWKKIKVATLIFFTLGIIAFIGILYSSTAYHFIKLLFDKKIHFGISGEPKAGYNFFLVIKVMLKDMMIGRPLSTTIWHKIYLMIPILCIIYLIGNRYHYFQKMIAPKNGKLIALFLLLSVVIVFFSNVFGAGLNTFVLTKNDFNFRYFLIPIFLGSLIIGYLFFNAISPFFKGAFAVIIAITLFTFNVPELKAINFQAYSNPNPYNAYISKEVQCLIHYDKKYHLHYGLADHFAAEAVNFYLPKSIYINQIVLSTGKIWHVMNNIDWYLYNPLTKKIPHYNFILSNQPWKNYPALLSYYGKPDKMINCGDQIYLGIYNQPNTLKILNQSIYQQAIQTNAAKDLLKKHHLLIPIKNS